LDFKNGSPQATPSIGKPLTQLQKQEGYVFVLVFAIWFPVYLIWFRPIINRWVFQHVDSYPAELHIIPAFALPTLITLGYRMVMRWRQRKSV
jgi:hypothetical protein